MQTGDSNYSHLLHDHQRLESRLERAAEALRVADRTTARREWDDFQRVLLGHLDWEEQNPLPGLDRAAPVEAALIRRDHARIRALLLAVGAVLEVRAASFEELIALLRSHATLEEKVLQQWADRGVPKHGHQRATGVR